jgi:signal transduction histidine kinase
MQNLRPTPGTVCLLVCAVVETGLLGWWLASGSTLGFLVLETLLTVVGAAVILVFRYLRFRRRYEAAIARSAVLAERNRLAEEMHDILGHELSVIALRAGSLQVRSTGGTQEAAAEIRRDVERAVDRLRQTLSVLRSDSHEVTYETVTEPIGAMIDRLRATGTVITLIGSITARLPDPTERTVYRVIREALTNAIKHAPDQPVTVTFEDGKQVIVLIIHNPVGSGHGRQPDPGHASSGIESLRRRVSLVGGELAVLHDGNNFTVTARFPRDRPLSPAASRASAPRPRPPLRATLLSAIVPSAAAIAVVVGFYAWSVHDDALDDHAFDRITAGMSANTAHALLPARQAPVRLLPSAPHDPAWDCAYYSDGNFPLGLAVFQVCYHDGAVVATADLRRESWL